MKGKSWIAWLCIMAALVQVGFAGLAGTAITAQAATVDTAPEEVAYYDLADGDYLVTGAYGTNGTLKVNGEAFASGGTLTAPGDYIIENTITDRNGKTVTSTQTVALYQRADAHPDGTYDVKDLVAIKKHIAGIEISEAGKMAIEAYNDAYTNDQDKVAMWNVLLNPGSQQQAKLEENFPKVSAGLDYNFGFGSEMPIGGFFGPGYLSNPSLSNPGKALTDYRTDEIYQLVKDLGINLIVATTNELKEGEAVETVVQKELEMAEKYGLKMFVQPNYATDVGAHPEYLEQYVKELSVYKSFAGINLHDEPYGADYHPSGATVTSENSWDLHEDLAQALGGYSNLTGYTNLLPYWAEMGTEAQYEAYLEEYFTRYGNPKQMSVDYYVFAENGGDRNPTEYFTTLKILKRVADKHGVPYWSIVQAGGEVTANKLWSWEDGQYIYEGHTLWNVNTSLAYGAKGITYYPLIQPWNYGERKVGSSFNYDRNGAIGADGTTTPYYAYIQKANKQILAVDEVLMNAKHLGIYATQNTTAATETGASAAGDGTLVNMVSTNGTAGAMAGGFDYHGQKAYYVVNYDYSKDNSQTVTLTFDADYSLAVTINGETTLVETNNKTCELALTSGEAALVLVNGAKGADSAAKTVIGMIEAIPENAEMPKYYTNVLKAKAAYDKLDKISKQNVSATLTAKLDALLVAAGDYSPVYTQAVKAEGFTSVNTTDDTYGNVTVLDVTGAAAFTDSLKRADIPALYTNIIFYVYNPGAAVNATYAGSDLTLASGWTQVTVSAESFGAGDNALTFASPVSGQWKVTHFYGKSDAAEAVAKVQAAIDALDVSTLTLAQRADVEAVRAQYESLPASKREAVDVTNLVACEAKLQRLQDVADGKPSLVFKNDQYGLPAEDTVNARNVYDDTYGEVMSFADAAYFAIPANQISDAYKTAKSAVLYVYNPTEQNAYLGAQLGNNGWIHRDRVTLYPQRWTAVELFDRGQTHTYESDSFIDDYLTSGEAIYFFAENADAAASTFTGEGWMVSGVYAMYDSNKNYVAGREVVYDVVANEGLPGTKNGYEVVDDEAFGEKVFAFTSTEWFAMTGDMKSDTFKHCDDVVFYLYNPTGTAVTGNITIDGSYTTYVKLQPKTWNRIVLANFGGRSGAQFLSGSELINFNFVLPESTEGKWKMTNFYGLMNVTDDGSAAAVEAMIDGLWEGPQAIAIKDFAAIDAAKKAYDALGEQQMFVDATKVAKLNACVSAMGGHSVAINAINGILDNPSTAEGYTVGTANDSEFGTVFTMTFTDEAARGFRLKGDLTGYTNRYFYIYNPSNTTETAWMYDGDNGWIDLPVTTGANPSQLVMKPGWNKVELPEGVEITDNFLGAIDGLAAGTWKISSVYAADAEALVQLQVWDVEKQIAALPAADSIGASHKAAINAAKAAYEALGDNKTQVTNATKLTDCVAKVDTWTALDNKTVLSISDSAAGLVDAGGSVVDNNTYGQVISIPSGRVNIVIKPAAGNTAYKASKGIEFYIYNPTESALTFTTQDGGTGAGWSTFGDYTLAAKQWTKIQVLEQADTADKMLIADGMELYFMETLNGDGWMVTSVYAMADADVNAAKAAEVDALIEALPEASAVVIENKVQIVAARTAYTALTEAQQALVTKLDQLVACEEKIAQLETPADKVGPVNAAIAALPEANQLTVANKQAVKDAQAAYSALSEAEQAQVVGKTKLQNCVDKVNFWEKLDAKTVVDARNANITSAGAGWAAIDNNVDDNTFGKVMTFGNTTDLAIDKTAAYKASKAIGFYIYNPTDAPVEASINDNNDAIYDFLLKANSWNYIEYTDSMRKVASDKHLINTDEALYIHGNFTGTGWKLSSFYCQLGDAEPSADDVAGAAIAVDASYQTVGADGTLNMNMDDTSFGKIYTVKGGTYVALTDVVKGEQATFRGSDNIVFYIYNPTGATVTGCNYTMDWQYYVYFQLEAGWNRICFADLGSAAGKQMISSTQTLYFYINFAGESWKVSSFYGMPDPTAVGTAVPETPVDPDAQAAAAVDAQIAALNLETLSVADKGTVEAARKAYTDLNEAAQAKVTKLDHLVACENKIAALEVEAQIDALPAATALKVSDKEAVGAAETAYNDLGDNKTLVNTEKAAKLEACIAKVNFWEKLDAKTVKSAAADYFLGGSTALTTNVDDNTFGKVAEIASGTEWIAVDSKSAEFKASGAVGFYIYNPTDTIVYGDYTSDWINSGYFKLNANSWNYIEISDCGKDYTFIDGEGKTQNGYKQWVSNDATVYIYVDFAGEGWKVSSFYSQNEGAADIEGATIVKDASNSYVLGSSFTLNTNQADAEFGKVMTVTGGASNSWFAVDSKSDEFKASKNIVFYIYNPTSEDVVLDVKNELDDWKLRKSYVLKKESWTRVCITDMSAAEGDRLISNDKVIYFYANMSGEGWKISSFYSLPEPGAN